MQYKWGTHAAPITGTGTHGETARNERKSHKQDCEEYQLNAQHIKHTHEKKRWKKKLFSFDLLFVPFYLKSFYIHDIRLILQLSQ